MTMQGIGECLCQGLTTLQSLLPLYFHLHPSALLITGAGDVQKCSGLGEGVLTTAVLSQYLMAFPRAGTLQRVCGQFWRLG